MRDEAVVAVVCPGLPQHGVGVAAPGDVGEPVAILGFRRGRDAFDILHHRKPERIGVDAGIARIVEARLEDDVGVAVQEFQVVPIRQPPRLMQPGEDAVMHPAGAAFVHHLRLALRVEILLDMANDPEDLALPGLQARRGLFQEIQQVFLRQLQQGAAAGFLGADGRRTRLPGQRAPEIVIDPFLMLAPLAFALLLAGQVGDAAARHAEDALGG